MNHLKDLKPASIHGFKTYIVAGVMMGLGGLFLGAASAQSWENPTATGAELAGAVKRVIGWLLLTQGAGLATLRHAIARMEDYLDRWKTGRK